MTTEPEEPQHVEADEPTSMTAKQSKRRAYSFVIIFISTVLVLLTGYHYAVSSKANDWYLLQVAKHTNIALGLVGEQSVLEDDRPEGEAAREIRATLKAWQQDREEPSEQEILEADGAKLTPWESWRYRAIRARIDGTDVHGPRIAYVWKAGIYRQIREVEQQIREKSQEDPTWTTSDEASQLQEHILELRTKQREAVESETGRNQLRGNEFTFVVIPECGAIEIMAIFFAAVLAFPTLWWKRLVGIAIGLPIMYGVNVFRLFVLAIIGALDHSKEWFNFTHEYIWQTAYIIFVIVFWLLWVELIVRRRAK